VGCNIPPRSNFYLPKCLASYVWGIHIYVVGRDHYEEVSIVATTTEMEKMGRTAEGIVKTAQQSAYTVTDYAVKAGEVNTEFLRKTTEVWIDGVRKQTELSQDMAREFFEKAEDQAHAYQDFFAQWGFPFMSFPFVRTPYDPFGFWREWTQTFQKTARDTQSMAWDTQQTAAEETARVIETTAPTNGSLPIAGYDEKSVGEITARLDALRVDQLARLKDYERRNKNRETLIREIDRRIGATS
jgi:hypothetical protein